MRYVVAYLAAIVAVNWSFVHVPPAHTPWGVWSVGTLGIGVVYVLRDYAQARYGHRVLLAMGAGIAVTAAMSPSLAFASGAAFALGESIEWLVFTLSGLPFRRRVLLSTLPGVVADTVVFLALAGFLSPANLATEVVLKLAALALVRVLPVADGAPTKVA